MNKPVTLILTLSLILALAVWISFFRYPETAYAQDGDVLPDQNDVEPVIMALTRLDVNDLILDVNDQIPDINGQAWDVNNPILKLRWKIKNGSEHDIWICKDIKIYGTGYDEEVYLDGDNKTLLIRRRLDVPTYVVWSFQPVSTYVRLRAGEDWTETLSLNLPVHSVRLFKPKFPESGIKYPPTPGRRDRLPHQRPPSGSFTLGALSGPEYS